MDKRHAMFRWILLILSALACLLLMAPFTKEILSAIFFAFALAPVTKALSHRKFFHRRGWVAVTLFGLILAILMPIVLLAYSVVRLANDLSSEGFLQSEFYTDMNHGKNALINSVNQVLDAFGFADRFDLHAFTNQFLAGAGSKMMTFSGYLASQIPDFVLSIFIFCCVLYMLLSESRKIRGLLAQNKLLLSAELDRLIPLLQKSCYTTLVASVFVGAAQAFVLSAGAFILGSTQVFLIFLITFIFSFVPVIGAAPVAFVLAFLTLVKGQYGIAIGYVIVGTIAGTMDNIIRPWLVRGKENIHPVLMLLAIIGAILIFGIPGVFLGPMFLAIAFQIYKLYVFEPVDSVNAEPTPMELINKT